MTGYYDVFSRKEHECCPKGYIGGFSRCQLCGLVKGQLPKPEPAPAAVVAAAQVHAGSGPQLQGCPYNPDLFKVGLLFWRIDRVSGDHVAKLRAIPAPQRADCVPDTLSALYLSNATWYVHCEVVSGLGKRYYVAGQLDGFQPKTIRRV